MSGWGNILLYILHIALSTDVAFPDMSVCNSIGTNPPPYCTINATFELRAVNKLNVPSFL